MNETWYTVFANAVRYAHDGVMITDANIEDPDGPRILYVNPAVERMTGYNASELVGRTPRLLQGPETDRAVLNRLKDDLVHGRTFEGYTVNYRKDGQAYNVEWTVSPVWTDQATVTHYVAIQRDITERIEHQRALAEDAYCDQLTGLYNRAKFECLMRYEIDRASRYGKSLGLIFIDLDHFKAFNDTYGHLQGDEVLKNVASVLAEGLRTPDHVARWGGEEFVVLLPEVDIQGAGCVAERLRGQVAEMIDCPDVTCSAGVAVLTDGMKSGAELLQTADRALYAAKSRGRNRIETADAMLAAVG